MVHLTQANVVDQRWLHLVDQLVYRFEREYHVDFHYQNTRTGHCALVEQEHDEHLQTRDDALFCKILFHYITHNISIPTSISCTLFLCKLPIPKVATREKTCWTEEFLIEVLHNTVTRFTVRSISHSRLPGLNGWGSSAGPVTAVTMQRGSDQQQPIPLPPILSTVPWEHYLPPDLM